MDEDQCENQQIQRICQGQVFEDYEEFLQHLHQLEKETFTKFSKIRSDKIAIKPGYSLVELGCKHFGKRRENKNLTGERPRQKSYKLGCDSFIRLKRTRDKSKLYIDGLNLQHSHDTTKLTAAGYPENRRVSKEVAGKVESLLKLKVTPTLIRPYLKNQDEDPNKLILGRDISNIGTKRKQRERRGRSNEEMLIDTLQEIKEKDPGADVHIEITPESNEVVFIFIQTSDMRENLKKYPEVILMDITYKINKNRMPVSVVDVMDGDGEGLVVAYAFLANETKDTLTSMLTHFVSVSGGESIFESTGCFVVDKAFEEIGALREVLPHVAIHICSVHTEKNFKLLAKGCPNKKELVVLMKSLIYCETQERFDEGYAALKLIAASGIMETFDKNWLGCKEAWSLKDKVLTMTLRNHSTNRVERHNRTLKTVFDVDTELHDAVRGLVDIILANKKDDKLYKMHEAVTKITYVNKCSDHTIQIICNDLTDFACKLVCEQLQLSKKPSPFPNKYQHDEVSCSCLLFKTLRLPCRHMMRYRRQRELPVYSKDIVLNRWWKEYSLGSGSANTSLGAVDQSELPNVVIQPRLPGEALANTLLPAEKYKKFVPLVPKLKTAVCSPGTHTFYLRYQVLNDIINAWNSGTEVAIVHLASAQINGCSQQAPCAFVDDGSEPQLASDKSESPSVPFVLPKVVVRGKPAGRNETIHDGSKKKGATKGRRHEKVVDDECCCVCGIKGVAAHKCVKCWKLVHGIAPCSVPSPEDNDKTICKNCEDVDHLSDHRGGQVSNPDDYIEASPSPPRQAFPNFNLKVVRTKGRPKHKGNGPPRWNYTSLADADVPTCCICVQPVDDNQVCLRCNNFVHGSHPCSNRHGVSGRVCNYCEGPSGVVGPPSPKQYQCYGCNTVLLSEVTKRGPNVGRVYYACKEKKTMKCMSTFFWQTTKWNGSQSSSKKGSPNSPTFSVTSVCDPPHSLSLESDDGHDSALAELTAFCEEQLEMEDQPVRQPIAIVNESATIVPSDKNKDSCNIGADRLLCATAGLAKEKLLDTGEFIDLTGTTDDDSENDEESERLIKTESVASSNEGSGHMRCDSLPIRSPDPDTVLASPCEKRKICYGCRADAGIKTSKQPGSYGREFYCCPSYPNFTTVRCRWMNWIGKAQKKPAKQKTPSKLTPANQKTPSKVTPANQQDSNTPLKQRSISAFFTAKPATKGILDTNLRDGEDGFLNNAVDSAASDFDNDTNSIHGSSSGANKKEAECENIETVHFAQVHQGHCWICEEEGAQAICTVCKRLCHHKVANKACSSSQSNLIVCKKCQCMHCGEPQDSTHMCKCKACGDNCPQFILCQVCRYPIHRGCANFEFGGAGVCKSGTCRMSRSTACANCRKPLHTNSEDPHMCVCCVCQQSVSDDDDEADIALSCLNCDLPCHINCMESVRNDGDICKSCACVSCHKTLVKSSKEEHTCLCNVCSEPAEVYVTCRNCSQPCHLRCMTNEMDKRSVCQSCTLLLVCGLTMKDIQMIKDGDMLQDHHIERAAALLRKQFPDLEGLAPLLVSEEDVQSAGSGDCIMSYKQGSGKSDYLQFVYTGYEHYILAVLQKGKLDRVYVLNSSAASVVGSFVEQQLALMVCSSKTRSFTVVFPPVKDMDDGGDASVNQCGPLSIAYAIEFALTRRIKYVDFDLSLLRPHLIKCFHEGKLLAFPRSSQQCLRKGSLEIVKVFCKCLMPEHFDNNMITCSNPKCAIKSYHWKCLGITEPPKGRSWRCSFCSLKK